MEEYKKRLAVILAETGAIFFHTNLFLKDGRPTPYFVNFGMFRTGRLSMALGSFFADMMVDKGLADGADVILGPSYKGSAIALATAIALFTGHGRDLLFEYDRKETKTHGEASGSVSLFVNRVFFEGCRVFIVDDVATSMGTKYDLLKRVEKEAETNRMAIKVVGIGIAIDREQTTAVYDRDGHVVPGERGEDAILSFTSRTNIPVHAVAGIREVIGYLYQEKVPVMIDGRREAIDPERKSQFDEYMKIYGVN